MKPRRLSSADPAFEGELDSLLAFENTLDPIVVRTVSEILADVRRRGDDALLDFTRRFDRLPVGTVGELVVEAQECRSALERLPAEQARALQAAAQRVRSYHERQLAQSWSYTESDGTCLGQQVTSLDRVGIYVPGGKAAYPSTVLMNAIPAKVAGVGEIIMVFPTPDGVRNELVLAASAVAGVDRVFTVGGAQAVGALAYGTQSVPRVDKIVGPGNAFVAAAKRQVFGTVGIDMVAGPSEILVICDGGTKPEWIAMDLFSQAEHDELAQAILLSPDASFLDAVERCMHDLLPSMPRKAVIADSVTRRGALIEVRSLEEACIIANRIAPEHLELSVDDPSQWLPKLRHAGAIFLGRYTSEALGDYCAGPNHVLPTAGTARFSSPLGVYDFQKRTSIIQVSREGARTLGAIAGTLADGEGLPAHAVSARYRLHA